HCGGRRRYFPLLLVDSVFLRAVFFFFFFQAEDGIRDRNVTGVQTCALPILRLPIVQMITRWYRNINLLSIAYAFRPQLRSRLTLSGRAFLRNPWAFGERDSHSFFVTHTGILTSTRSISPHDLTS